jgi:hypothetical protein
LFSHPEALQVSLTDDDGNLFDAPGSLNVILELITGTQSVFGLSGERHRRARQLLMPPFHGERMRSYGSLIRNITEQVMDEYKTAQPFLARKPMQSISLRVPAGVVHKNLDSSSSDDFGVVGAHPEGRHWDLCYGRSGERARGDGNIVQAPMPELDPVYGAAGPLRQEWK